MKHTYITVLMLFLLISYVSSQDRPVDYPTQSSPIEQLNKNLQKNTETTEKVIDKVKELPSIIEQQFNEWIGIHLVGNAIFMSILYLSIVFIDHIRKKRQKKSREDYIRDLEERLISYEQGIIAKIKYEDKLLTRLNTRLKLAVDILEQHSTLKQSSKQYYIGLIIGFILGLTTLYIFLVF